MNPKGKVTVLDRPALVLGINKRTGLFTGSFKQGATGHPRAFNGAVFQKQNRGAGLFIAPGGPGSVELRQIPVQE